MLGSNVAATAKTKALAAVLHARRKRRTARAAVAAVTDKALAQGKLLDALRRYKRKPAHARKLPPRPFPHAAELQYRAALVGWLRGVHVKIATAIGPLLTAYEKERLAARGDSGEARRRAVISARRLSEEPNVRTDARKENLQSTIARARASIAKQTEREARRMARKGVDVVNQRSLADLNRQFGAVLEGVPLFSSVSPAAERVLGEAFKENVGLIESIPQQLLDQVADVLSAGFERGARVEVIQDELQERFEVSESRAELIARDQVGKINGQLVEARAGELGMDEYVWQTSLDERVRGTPGGLWPRGNHFQLHGTTQKYSEPPIVDERTGRRANPGEDFQCLTGHAQVTFADPVRKLFRRWLRTNIAAFVTESGVRLEATPNHPVLTSRGWVAAHALQIGDHVFRVTEQGRELAKGHVQDRVPQFADLFEACALRRKERRALGAAAQFHNDGSDEEIHVVDIDPGLLLDLQTASPECFGELFFAVADADRARLGATLGDAQLVLPSQGDAPRGRVRGASHCLALGLGRAREAQEVRRAPAPDRDSALLEHARERGSGNPGLPREGQQGHSALVGGRGLVSVVLDRVVGVTHSAFSGYVYNCETSSGYYAANGLVVHNCRCSALPNVDGMLDALGI